MSQNNNSPDRLRYNPLVFDKLALVKWQRQLIFLLFYVAIFASLWLPYYFYTLHLEACLIIFMAAFLGARRSMLLLMLVFWFEILISILMANYFQTQFSLMFHLLIVAFVAGKLAEYGWVQRVGSTLVLVLVSVLIANGVDIWDLVFNINYPVLELLYSLLTQIVLCTVLVLLIGPVLWKYSQKITPDREKLIDFIEASRIRRPFRSSFLGGLLIILAGIASAGTLGITIASRLVESDFIIIISLIIGGVILAYLVIKSFSLGQKLLSISIVDLLRIDERNHVLYLRPFNMDKLSAQEIDSYSDPRLTLPKLTEEENLVKALHQVGPVVAIGKPGELLPQRGAARVYVDDEQWKSVVERLIVESRLVVLTAGSSVGIHWELSKAKDILKPSQLLILVSSKMSDYDAFREWVERELGILFPEQIDDEHSIGSMGNLYYFTEDWQAQLYISQKLKVSDQFKFAIIDMFSQQGIDIKCKSKRWQWVFISLLLFGYASISLSTM